jgi:hypothetical protein
MASQADSLLSISAVAERAASELVRVTNWGSFSYISLPIFMPSGSAATVRISRIEAGFRVDDGGFTYRELESIGSERSFPRAAAKFAAYDNLETDRRLIFAVTDAGGLARAIGDVGAASYGAAYDVYRRQADEGTADVEE